MTSMKDLAREYFKFLPALLSGNKADSEPLQHPIFTFGDLRQVMKSEAKLRESSKGK